MNFTIFKFILSLSFFLQTAYLASVPVVWTASSLFRAGTFNCLPSTSGASQQFSSTYVTPLSAAPIKKPALGISGINYNFNNPKVYLRIQLQSWSNTGLVATLNVQFNGAFSMKMNYLAPDPSMTYQYSSFSYSIPYSPPAIAPFNLVYSTLGISGLNPGGLNLANENIMIVFINFMDLSSSTNCYDITVNTRVSGQSSYQAVISSGCSGMSMSLIGWSRIVFDKTAIQGVGYCYFQVGKISGYNNDSTTLLKTFRPYLQQNFMLGLNQFKYTSTGSPISMKFQSTLGNTTYITTSSEFAKLGLIYWTLRYRNCPASHQYFQLSKELCHDVCPIGTYTIESSKLCKDCFYTCQQCSSYPSCSGCSSSSNRYLNGTRCLPIAGFYENGTAFAPPCSTGCIDCTSGSNCFACGTGFVLNTSTNSCDKLCEQGCSTCSNFSICYSCQTSFGYYLVNTTCQYCDPSLNYFINSSDISSCQLCTIQGCIQCQSLQNCLICNISQNYTVSTFGCQYCNSSENRFINSNQICQMCSLVGCVQCQSLAICLVCNISDNYYLDNLICNYCNASYNNFINLTTEQCEICTLEGCTQCSSLTSCSVCNTSANFYLLNSQCQYCNSSYNNFINASTLSCQPCSLEGCSQCSSLTVCTTCENQNNFYLLGLTCDFCNNSLNEFINPNSSFCEPCNLQNCVMCVDLLTCRECNQTDIAYFPNTIGLCEICKLEGCIECESLTKCKTCNSSLGYSLSKGICDLCTGCRCYSQNELPSLVPSIQYTDEQCHQLQQLNTTILAIGIISYIVMFFSSFSTILIGIQLIGVLQLAYLNLADNKFIHLYLSPILKLSFVNGYNWLPDQHIGVPINIEQIGYTNLFLKNINIMFLLLSVITLVFLPFQHITKTYKISAPKLKKIIKQIFISLYLFNSFNFGFGISLHMMYFRNQDRLEQLGLSSILCTFCSLAMYLVVILWLIFSRRLKCGQFTSRFKKDTANQLYIPFTLIYRFGLGMYLGFSNQSDNGTLIAPLFAFIYLFYNLINLPYEKAYHNYRANTCHISHLIILFVTNYYRNMKKNVDIQTKSLINQPAYMELAFIFGCVGVSLICCVYQLIKKIRKSMQTNLKILIKNSSSRNDTQYDMNNQIFQLKYEQENLENQNKEINKNKNVQRRQNKNIEKTVFKNNQADKSQQKLHIRNNRIIFQDVY